MRIRVDARQRDAAAVAYRGPQPLDMRPDLVIDDALPADERLWVPLDDGVWTRPLSFNVTQGQYTHVMRVTKQDIIARHRHTGWVFGHVLRGEWHYLEHDWRAQAGSVVFEPPGQTHTLVVPEGCPEMITLFQVTGALIYVDPDGIAIGYDDVFSRLEKTRSHASAIGLEQAAVDRMVY